MTRKLITLTSEDFAIFTRHSPDNPVRSFLLGWRFAYSLEQDRRDGNLMLMAQTIAAHGPAAIELHGIACRGWSLENG